MLSFKKKASEISQKCKFTFGSEALAQQPIRGRGNANQRPGDNKWTAGILPATRIRLDMEWE
jgi:hypothetical protein